MLVPILKYFGQSDYETGLKPNPIWIQNRFSTANAFIGSAKESIFSNNLNIRAIYILRFTSIVLASLTVFFTYKISDLIFMGRQNFTSLATVLVAFNPQFVFHSSSIANDNLAILLTTLAIFLMVKTTKSVKINPKTSLVLGLVVGLSIITKLNLLFLVVVIFIFLLMLYREKFLQILKTGFFILTGILISGGWYFYLNLSRYGEPFGISAQTQMFSIFSNKNTGYHLLNDVLLFFMASFQTYWGMFGWYNIYMPQAYYLLILLIILFSMWGLWNYFKNNVKTIFKTTLDKQLLILLLSVFILWGSMLLTFVKYPVVSNGRFLFPTIAPFAVLMVFGVKKYLLKFNLENKFINLLALGGFLINILILFIIILPKYQ